ncbi:DUF4214 domain-containing protein [Massilia agri]|uniref:DUF4214 domain-containing protein n=1 Tax=Massilia agri TaxID=1886785 RepID=A0ABT2AM17_9BURK|nr:DUF4214 domain-containing protein [Massilia agri]MCS0597293.1 DUF4214 domain-containing protein [Massilia agri]
MAAQDYFGVVQQLYISYFGRPADPNGLQNFASQLDEIGAPKDFNALQAAVQADKAGTTPLGRLVNTFNSSAESATLYGTDNSLIGIQKFVAAIYQNVLGREADISGFNFWVGEITSGRLTKAYAAASITQAALVNTTEQGKLDAQTVQNKLAVATAFTDALDTPTELIAYSGDAAAAAARSLLSGVKSSTSVTAYQANINATIDQIVNVAVPGQTFTLTAGVDTPVATAGNDTFNALSVKADGSPGSTLNNFDSIDGGAGKDTLNIYTDVTNSYNTTLGANTTITNVETINIYNANGAATNLTDASKYVGATALWQIGTAGNVTNLSSTTAAGFRSSVAATSVTVGVVDAATSATIALDKVQEGATFAVNATATGKLATVTVAGNAVDADADGSVAPIGLDVTGGLDVQTLVINSAVAIDLGITDNGDAVTTINASGSTGAITYADSETTVANITTGSGDDNVTIVAATLKDDTATTANETLNATVNTGAGDDTIDIQVTGTGLTTIIAGEGDDTVTLTSRGAGGTLDIQLGAGDDTFTAAVAIGANDKVDAGAGTDTLLLNLVGSANVGAFSNFDVFDAAGLNKALDLDILTQKNTVTEIVASGDVLGTASLTNVGAGVGVRVTADIGTTNTLTLTQKTAGAMTVTVDADETGTGDTAIDTVGAKVAVTNATSLKAVFDTSYLDDVTGETTTGDNVTTLQLSGGAATSVTVESGGENANNVLAYADASTGTTGKLATITVTGSQALTLSNTFAATNSGLTTVDSSALTGGLDFSLANLANGGKVILGSGADTITVTTASTVAGAEVIQGFEKAAAAAVAADASATAKAAAIADADVLSFAGAVANAATFAGGTLENGVVTFTGSGPGNLTAAADIAALAAESDGEAVVFEYLGNSYVFVQGATDILVQLAGVTGVKNLVENGTTDEFFIV